MCLEIILPVYSVAFRDCASERGDRFSEMAGDHLQRLSEESVAVEKGVLLEDTRSEELTLCHACELRKKRWFRYSVAILEGRLSFYGHDFLKPQPIEGADVYLLRMILHDWPDKYAIQILRNIVPAMRPGARVILNESCVPEPGSVSVQREKRVR